MGRKRSSGFTLLELLITVVLVGILAAIAIPSYSAYVTRGQRAAAKAALEQAAQYLERNYTVYGNYSTGASGVAVTLPNPYAPTDGGQITYALSATFPTPQSFSLTAAPCGGASCPSGSNSNFNDTDCGTLTLDNTGLKNTSGGTLSADACWSR
jgi:type IV pilus assembly protein PilE